MPGIKSLEYQEYYAHPRNAFWKIISCLFNQSHNFSDYKNKCSCLLSHNIGLWDSLQTCSRIGSLDANITHEIPNNFNLLFEQYWWYRHLLASTQPAPGLLCLGTHYKPDTRLPTPHLAQSNKPQSMQQEC